MMRHSSTNTTKKAAAPLGTNFSSVEGVFILLFYISGVKVFGSGLTRYDCGKAKR
jgi:hypothetical protein